jgi:hypothetical protein
MGACVLLLHELSDGDSHYDWLIDRHEPAERAEAAGDPGERALIAFRLSDRIDLALPPQFDAQRLADHRRVYLTYEGPVSGGRGRVRRVASGRMRVKRASEHDLVLVGGFGEARGRLSGAAVEGGRWVFSTGPVGEFASAGGF